VGGALVVVLNHVVLDAWVSSTSRLPTAVARLTKELQRRGYRIKEAQWYFDAEVRTSCRNDTGCDPHYYAPPGRKESFGANVAPGSRDRSDSSKRKVRLVDRGMRTWGVTTCTLEQYREMEARRESIT
jgi:predicted phosphoribosyltransferase